MKNVALILPIAFIGSVMVPATGATAGPRGVQEMADAPERPTEVVLPAVAVAVSWVWHNVPDGLKQRLKDAAIKKLKALGRKIVKEDTGKDVETMSLDVSAADDDGDGDIDDYKIHAEVEDHDGDGDGDGDVDEDADDPDELVGDLDDALAKQVRWLSEHGR